MPCSARSSAGSGRTGSRPKASSRRTSIRWAGRTGSSRSARSTAHVREEVGIFDQSSFAKYELTGRDALQALDWICANDVAKPAGRLTYTQLLNTRGGIEADLTVARLAEDKFYIVTGTGFRTHDLAWIGDHIGDGLDARLDRRHRRIRHAVADGAAGARRAGGGDRRRRLQRRLPVRPCARDRHRRPHGAGAARHLCRRARLGTACADRRHRRGVRRADGGRRAARHPAGRLSRAGIAQAGKGLPRLGLRHHAQRHAVRGGARLGGEAPEEHRLPRPARAGEGQRRSARRSASPASRSTIPRSCCSAARRSCATASRSAI